MVDSNLHRARISYSEKAFAYKLKNDVLKRKSGRKKSQVDHKKTRKRSIDIISEDCGDSPKQVQRYISLTKLIPEMLQKLDDEIISFCPAVEIAALSEKESGTKSRTDQLLGEQVGESARSVQRYIRLTELIPELLDLVDNKKLQFTVAVDISYIDKEVQGWIYEYICDTGFIKPKQIAALRNQLNDGPINQIQMLSIFNNCVMAKKVSRSLTFSEKKLTKYFPDDYTAKDMEQVIESLLEKWMQEQSC